MEFYPSANARMCFHLALGLVRRELTDGQRRFVSYQER